MTRSRSSWLIGLLLVACSESGTAPTLEPQGGDRTDALPATEVVVARAGAEPSNARIAVTRGEEDVVVRSTTTSTRRVEVSLNTFRVRRPIDGPFPVEIGMERIDGSLEVLARWEIGPDLALTGEVEVPDHVLERLWVRPCGPGWIQRRTRLRPHEDLYRATVYAIHGATARAVVVDAAGDPVSASLELLFDGRTLPMTARSFVRSPGHLDLHFQRSGRHEVRLRSSGSGTAIVEDLELDLDDPPQGLRFQLAGPERITGRIIHPDGHVHADLPLLLMEARSDRDPQRKPSTWSRVVRSGGLHWDVTRTAEDGTFAFEGLAPGLYELHADTLGESRFRHRLTEGPIPTGTTGLRIVHQDHRITVRFVSPEGNPVDVSPRSPGALRGIPQRHRAAPRGPWEPTDTPQMEIRRSDGRGRAAAFLGYDPWMRSEEPGTWFLRVRGDAHYLLGVVARGIPLDPIEFHVPVGQKMGDLEVVVPMSQEPGTARIEFDYPSPAGSDRWSVGGPNALEVSLFAQDSGVLLDRYSLRPSGTYETTLPPGAYELTAEPQATMLICGTGVSTEDRRILSDAESISFVVRPGQTTRRTIGFRAKCRLVVHVRKLGTPSPERRMSERAFERGPDGDPAERIRVTVRDGNGSTRTLRFRAFTPDAEGGLSIWTGEPADEVEWLPLDHKVDSLNELEPGPWTVEAHLPGFTGMARTVELDNGEIRFVELILAPNRDP